MKVYLVMAWNYPDRIFDSLDKAIEYCKDFAKRDGRANHRIDVYEVNGKQDDNKSVWNCYWWGPGEEFQEKFL